MATANESKTSPIGEVRIYDAPTQSKIWEAVPTGTPLIAKEIIEFEYIESIYDSFVRANMSIFESSGAFEKAFNGCGVRNFCMIEVVQFNDPLKDTDDSTRTRKDLSFTGANCFFVSKVRQIIQNKKQIYELELVTRDALTSLASNVLSTWPPNESTKIDYNFIVEDILKRWIYATKKLDVQEDKSKPTTKYNGNGMQPFQVIHDICSKATSVRWSSSGTQEETGATGYMFFERYDAYKFTSVASLINLSAGEEAKESHRYKIIAANSSETTPKEQAYSILSYKFNDDEQTSDVIQEIRSKKRGKPATFVLDPHGQVFKKIESLDPIKDPCEVTSVDKSFVRNTYKEVGYYEYSAYNSCSNELDNEPLSVALTSLNYSALLEELRTRNSVLRVNGNFDISSGDKIYITVPEIKGDGASATSPSDKYSGTYVVTKVAHRLENYKFLYTDLVIAKIKDKSGATVKVPQ